jgi:hypothetical protein
VAVGWLGALAVARGGEDVGGEDVGGEDVGGEGLSWVPPAPRSRRRPRSEGSAYGMHTVHTWLSPGLMANPLLLLAFTLTLTQ